MPRKRANASPAEPGPVVDPALFLKTQNFPDDPAAFELYCRSYPAANPAGVLSYVYRLAEPKIDRSQTGHKESHLEKLAGEIVTADAVARSWGSGRFMLLFNDTSRSQHQQIAKCTFTIDDPHLEPVVDPAEIVICEQNSRWINKYKSLGWTVETRTKLDGSEFQQLLPPQKQAANAGSAEQVLAQTVRDLAGAGASSGNSVVIDRELFHLLMSSKRGGEDNSIDRAFEIADRLKPNDQVTATLITKLADLITRDRAPNPAPPSADPLANIKTTAEFLRELGWSAPGAAAAVGRNSGAGWADVLVALPGILQQGAAFLGSFIQMQMAAAMAKGGPAPAPGLIATGAPAAGPMFAPAAAAAGAPAASGGPDVLNPLKVRALMEVGQRAVAAFESGVSGEDFAEQLCADPQTEPMYDDLLGMGRDRIMSALSMVPGLAEQLAPRRDAMVAWIDSFLAYGDPGAELPGAVDSQGAGAVRLYRRQAGKAILAWLAACGLVRSEVQSAGSTNRPACPVCKHPSAEESELGWLVVSSRADAIAPVGYSGVKVILCVGCGALFGVAAPKECHASRDPGRPGRRRNARIRSRPRDPRPKVGSSAATATCTG